MVSGLRQRKVARTLQHLKQTTNTVESVMGSVNSFEYYEDEEMLGLFDEYVLEADSVSEDVDLLLLDWELIRLNKYWARYQQRSWIGPTSQPGHGTRLSPAALQFLY